jgi:hypothetical protein
VFCRAEDWVSGRWNISDQSEPLQVATIYSRKHRTFPAHYHIAQTREFSQTQEVWIVVTGWVEVTIFDLDNSPAGILELFSGGIAIMYRGGHSFQMGAEAKVVEVKTGPYIGREADKELIE